MTVPVYLKSNQGPVGESCLLGTDVIMPLGVMILGLGVETRERW